MVSYRMSGMHKTTLYLPAELRLRLRELARRTRRPQAEIVREAVEQYLGPRSQLVPASIGADEDDLVMGRDSEAWLREQWDER
jgi:predicted transcriptional regulator